MTSYIKDIFKRFSKDTATSRIDPEPSSLTAPRSAMPAGAMLRGVHFFSAHDPITCLESFRPERLDEEMQAIRDDGFDHLILLLPWHALFPENERARLDAWYAERVLMLLQAAHRQKLKVLGRIFYAHSPNPRRDEWLSQRIYGLLHAPKQTAQALGAQARQLAGLVGHQPAWAGAFISWEDFWPCFDGPPRRDLDDRIALAQSSGFSRWVDEYRMVDAALQAGLVQQDDIWPIPIHQQESMRLWVGFFDHLLRERILKPCAEAFPELGIEVRTEAYPVVSDDGSLDWAYFDDFKDWSGQRHLRWAPYDAMVHLDQPLDAGTATKGLQNLLERQGTARKPLLSQFNFGAGSLHGVEQNAHIADAHLPSFLARSAEVLEQLTAGYALWSYRDYRENWIENASFQRLSPVWTGLVLGLDEAGVALLAPLAKLRQIVCPELHAQAPQSAYQRYQCEIETDNLGLEIRLTGQAIAGRPLRPGWLAFDVPAEQVNWQCTELCIVNPGFDTARLRSVYLYGSVQRMKLRNEWGALGPRLQVIRQLNRTLSAGQTG